MIIDFKKNIVSFLIDILFIFWIIHNITKSEVKTLFYLIFLSIFIISVSFLSIFADTKISEKSSEWERVLYVLGILLFIANFKFVKNTFLLKYSLIYYNDVSLILSIFFLSLGAFILFLRIRETTLKVKKILK